MTDLILKLVTFVCLIVTLHWIVLLEVYLPPTTHVLRTQTVPKEHVAHFQANIPGMN